MFGFTTLKRVCLMCLIAIVPALLLAGCELQSANTVSADDAMLEASGSALNKARITSEQIVTESSAEHSYAILDREGTEAWSINALNTLFLNSDGSTSLTDAGDTTIGMVHIQWDTERATAFDVPIFGEDGTTIVGNRVFWASPLKDLVVEGYGVSKSDLVAANAMREAQALLPMALAIQETQRETFIEQTRARSEMVGDFLEALVEVAQLFQPVPGQ